MTHVDVSFLAVDRLVAMVISMQAKEGVRRSCTESPHREEVVDR